MCCILVYRCMENDQQLADNRLRPRSEQVPPLAGRRDSLPIPRRGRPTIAYHFLIFVFVSGWLILAIPLLASRHLIRSSGGDRDHC
jgi:hypothetical protein